MTGGKLTGRQIEIILDAVAHVEGWDANHASIQTDQTGGWVMERGMPVPSRALVRQIRARERLEAAREKAAGAGIERRADI